MTLVMSGETIPASPVMTPVGRLLVHSRTRSQEIGCSPAFAPTIFLPRIETESTSNSVTSISDFPVPVAADVRDFPSIAYRKKSASGVCSECLLTISLVSSDEATSNSVPMQTRRSVESEGGLSAHSTPIPRQTAANRFQIARTKTSLFRCDLAPLMCANAAMKYVVLKGWMTSSIARNSGRSLRASKKDAADRTC